MARDAFYDACAIRAMAILLVQQGTDPRLAEARQRLETMAETLPLKHALRGPLHVIADGLTRGSLTRAEIARAAFEMADVMREERSKSRG